MKRFLAFIVVFAVAFTPAGYASSQSDGAEGGLEGFKRMFMHLLPRCRSSLSCGPTVTRGAVLPPRL